MAIRASIAAFVLVALFASGAAYQSIATARDLAAAPAPGQMVDVGGHELHVLCSGTGSPSVVLESSGLGNFMLYEKVQPGIARFARVCSYDRAGMGYSEPGPMPRTLERLSSDLGATIQGARLPPPYLLAGSSAGGIVVQHYAAKHPADVCGLVLIDSPHEDFTLPRSREKAIRSARLGVWLSRSGLLRLIDPFHLGADRAARATAYRPQALEAGASLVENLEPSLKELRELPPLHADLPLVVLTIPATASCSG